MPVGADSPHLPRVDPGCCPGGVRVRLVTETGVVLADRCVDLADLDLQAAEVRARRHGDTDVVTVHTWLVGHPTDVVRVYTYDGDSGVCLMTCVVPGPARPDVP